MAVGDPLVDEVHMAPHIVVVDRLMRHELSVDDRSGERVDKVGRIDVGGDFTSVLAPFDDLHGHLSAPSSEGTVKLGKLSVAGG